MIQGYRMAGPPPHGEPPAEPPPSREQEWPPWLGFVTLLGVFVIANLGYALVLGISGADTDDPPAWVDLVGALILQLTLIGAAVGVAGLFKPLHAWQFGLRPTRFWSAIGWSALAMVGFFVFAILWAALVNDPEQSTAEDLGAGESQLALVAAGVMFVIIAPVAEELFFRGFFYGSLRTRLPVIWAALISGIVFGAIHAPTGASAVPALIVLGVVFCLVREKTGSLYPCIAMHAFNNAFAYASLTDVDVGIAAGLGVCTIAATALVPRFAWRRQPA